MRIMEASLLRRRKYRSRQTITSSMSVSWRSVVNCQKRRLVGVGAFNVRTLRTDLWSFVLLNLADDLKVDVLVIQEHSKSQLVVDLERNLPIWWQILLGAPTASGDGVIGFPLSSRCWPWLLYYKFVNERDSVASYHIGIRYLHVICV